MKKLILMLVLCSCGRTDLHNDFPSPIGEVDSGICEHDFRQNRYKFIDSYQSKQGLTSYVQNLEFPKEMHVLFWLNESSSFWVSKFPKWKECIDLVHVNSFAYFFDDPYVSGGCNLYGGLANRFGNYVSLVRVSNIINLPERTRAIFLHEMGHTYLFYCFPVDDQPHHHMFFGQIGLCDPPINSIGCEYEKDGK